MLAFVASLAQAGGAIVLILVASMALCITSGVSMTWASFYFDNVSTHSIVTLGCWLVWSKIIRPAWTPKLNFEPVSFLTRPEAVCPASHPPGRLDFRPSMRA